MAPAFARPFRETPMSSALHQMTVGYSAEEDRLLLKISTKDRSELQLWLTRRFVKVLWDALLKILERHPDIRDALDPKVREAMLAMQHHDAMQSSDFSQVHDKNQENRVINENPLLIVGGKCTHEDKGLTRLKLKTANGKEIDLALNAELLHALCHMLVSTTQRAEWDVNLFIGGGNVFVPEDKTLVH